MGTFPRGSVITGPHIPLDPGAEDQLRRVANLPGCLAAMGMPDLHKGPTCPIGAAFLFDHIRPALVGTDAGCGVRVTFVRCKLKLDAMARRIEAAFEDAPFADAAVEARVSALAFDHDIAGLADEHSFDPVLRELARREPRRAGTASASGPSSGLDLSGLGTIGGGNHFAEVSRVDPLEPAPDAPWMNPADKHLVAIVVHSGSRGVGVELARRWGDAELRGQSDQSQYLAELAGALRFAAANRFLLAWRLIAALGAARIDKIVGSFDLEHNVVLTRDLDGQTAWLHRKGAAPAEAGTLSVVLGSRGTPSFVVHGHGNAQSLWSVAHGAGRRISRTDARGRFKRAGAREDLRRTALGGRVICDDPRLLFEEHPQAYKPIEHVMDALERADTSHRVAALWPMVTVKK